MCRKMIHFFKSKKKVNYVFATITRKVFDLTCKRLYKVQHEYQEVCLLEWSSQERCVPSRETKHTWRDIVKNGYSFYTWRKIVGTWVCS